MSDDRSWLKVAHRAMHDSANVLVEEVLATRTDIGLPSSNAWMSRVTGSDRDISEVSLSIEDIACGFGFELDVEYDDMEPRSVSVWSPLDDLDRRTVLRDLDLDSHERGRVEHIFMETLSDESASIYAVRDPDHRKTKGIIAFGRDLVFFGDSVVLEYSVWAFHCTDDIVLRGALLAAFHNQVVSDLQCALDSMARAGISPSLTYTLEARGSDIEDALCELIDLARENLFETENMPHVDINAYGSWLSGDKADDIDRILIRPPATPPATPSATCRPLRLPQRGTSP